MAKNAAKHEEARKESRQAIRPYLDAAAEKEK